LAEKAGCAVGKIEDGRWEEGRMEKWKDGKMGRLKIEDEKMGR
jgi:hypothetical protein